MKAIDIIEKISKERGIDSIGKNTLDLIRLNDLNVHRKEIWSLSITTRPEDYFYVMDRRSGNRIAYHFKFEVPDPVTAKSLCSELSKNFGTDPCTEFSNLMEEDKGKKMFLAIHIYPEFNFTPKKDKKDFSTQQLVLNFV